MATAGKKRNAAFAANERQKKSKVTTLGTRSTGYVDGALVRIKLENFVTYDSVEFRPGPHLNVIIGPNGTGKSTIVCAICLGLAGKTSFLARAQQPSEYIKHGCQKATVELELFNPGGENYVVRREIHRNNQSHWMLNGKQGTLKAVEELVSRLRIQIGNLCQFLPQEKVADFAKMTPQEVLENTEKAVGPVDMFETHCDLKRQRDQSRQLELDCQRTSEKLAQETAQNARLEQDVKNYEEQQKHLEQVKLLKMKRPWVEYTERKAVFQVEKERKRELADKIKEASKCNQPLRNRLDAAKKEKENLDRKMKEKQELIKKTASQATNQTKKIEEEDETLLEVQEELKQKKREDGTRKRKIADLQHQKDLLDSELSNLDEENVQPLLDKVSGDIRVLNQQMNQCNRQGEQIRNDREGIRRDAQDLQDELRRLQDVSNQRLNALKRDNQDAFKGVQWLRANQDQLSSTIHEPLMLLINMKNPRLAKFVENHIPYNDRIAFVCEDKTDMNHFLRVMETQKIKVNAAIVPREPLSSFRPPKPIDAYKNYGFLYYLKDIFECPEAVMRYLCRMYNIHAVPIGTDRTKNIVQKVISECPELHRFYTENHSYSIRKSKYADVTSTRCSELRGPRQLTGLTNPEKEEEIRTRLQVLQTRIQQKEANYTQLQKELEGMNKKMNDLREEKNKLMKKKNMRITLTQQIQTKQQKIQRLESEALNIEAEEARTHQRVRQINAKKCKCLSEMKDRTRIFLELSLEKVRLSLRYAEAASEVATTEAELREQSVTLQNLQVEFKALDKRVTELKDAAKKLLSDAKKVTNTPANEDLSDQLKQAFTNLPESLDEIDAMIHEEQARAECTFSADESVVREYQQRQAEIARIEKDQTTKQQQLERRQQNMEELKQKWMEPLKELVARISNNFSNFFRSLRCAGEVSLAVPDNPEDFERYGIHIKVKFRDSEALHELMATHQSGGEKSVATVLYMMSLQELTHCPFRCVDEINQGMDPQNERKVFELVVKTACREHTSQYFLLTPKLLPDLDYNERMTVLCIYNGPTVLNHTDWNIQKFLRRRAREDNNTQN